jgi:signal transduction histidine kinase
VVRVGGGGGYVGGPMVSATSWAPTRRSVTFDVVLAAAFGVGAGVSLYMGGDPFLAGENADYSRPTGIVLMAALVGCVTGRRAFPLVALGVATVVFVPLRVWEIPEYVVSGVTYFVVLYSAGAYGGARRHAVRAATAVVILGLVGWSIAYQSDGYDGRVPLELVNAFGAAQNIFYLAAAWMLGDLVHNRRRREAVLEAQAEALRRAQADSARRAVLDERLRIARELHDVVAHHVSVMGVQAGAARRMLDRRPEAVPDLLSSVEQSSREAVDELQGMLGLLRRDDEGDRRPATAAGDGGGAGAAGVEGSGHDDAVRGGGHDGGHDGASAGGGHGDGDHQDGRGSSGEPGGEGDATAARSPQPTLARLDDLVDQMREAGLRIELRGDGADGWLPLGVDLAAYRIVQEALTNTLKHAGVEATAEVVVARRPDALEIAVVDDGAAATFGVPAAGGDGTASSDTQAARAGRSGSSLATGGPVAPIDAGGLAEPDPDAPGGHGLVGMRERVRLLGGELRTQRRSGGGFEVRAWLPLGSARVRV